MLLVLCRHGDTFEPGEVPVWVGSRNDLPLARNGKVQADKTGEALRRSGVEFPRLICAPLKRTSEYAAIIASALALQTPLVDSGLTEIDYGGWSGLSSEQLAARYGKPMLEAWEERGQFPPPGIWGETESQVIQRIQQFISRFRGGRNDEGNAVAVTSNGILRLLCANLLTGSKPAGKEMKVRTGHSCIIEISDAGVVARGWNLAPADLTRALRE